MSTKMILRCDACDKSVEISLSGELPAGWMVLQFARTLGCGKGKNNLHSQNVIVHACSEACMGYSPDSKKVLHQIYRRALETSLIATAPPYSDHAPPSRSDEKPS